MSIQGSLLNVLQTIGQIKAGVGLQELGKAEKTKQVIEGEKIIEQKEKNVNPIKEELDNLLNQRKALLDPNAKTKSGTPYTEAGKKGELSKIERRMNVLREKVKEAEGSLLATQERIRGGRYNRRLF